MKVHFMSECGFIRINTCIMIPPAMSFVDVAANISYRPLLEAADTDC